MATMQNVVTTANFGCRVDLVTLAWKYSGKYAPKSFAACQVRIQYPKTTALIFASGKIVCAGARSESLSRMALYVYARMVGKIHPTARIRGVKVQNIVASGFLENKMNLTNLYKENYSTVQYDPDIFPGARITLALHGMHATVFLSGKVILSGAKTRGDIHEAWDRMYDMCKPHFRTEKSDTDVTVEHKDITITMQNLIGA